MYIYNNNTTTNRTGKTTCNKTTQRRLKACITWTTQYTAQTQNK